MWWIAYKEGNHLHNTVMCMVFSKRILAIAESFGDKHPQSKDLRKQLFSACFCSRSDAVCVDMHMCIPPRDGWCWQVPAIIKLQSVLLVDVLYV